MTLFTLGIFIGICIAGLVFAAVDWLLRPLNSILDDEDENETTVNHERTRDADPNAN